MAALSGCADYVIRGRAKGRGFCGVSNWPWRLLVFRYALRQATPMKQEHTDEGKTIHFHVHGGDDLLGHAAHRRLANSCAAKSRSAQFLRIERHRMERRWRRRTLSRSRLAQAGDAGPALSLHAQRP